MACNVLKLKGFEVFGSTFQDRKFKFQNRNIIGDSFKIVVYNNFSKIKEIVGTKLGNEVNFSYKTLESLKSGSYKIEFWANFSGIGNEIIAIEEFLVSLNPGCIDQDNDKTFTLDYRQEVINFTIQYTITNNSGGGGSEITPEQVKEKYESNANTNAFTDSDKSKLSGLQNYNDTAIQNALSNKVDKQGSKVLSDNNYTTPEKQKLANLENYNDASIINLLSNKVDKVANKQLSTNDFTNGEKQKLAGLESSRFKGKFQSYESLSLQTDNAIGSYAYVGIEGEDDQSYIWDDDDNIWVANSGSSTAETPASIKSKYESNPDTNAFTNARRDKLANLENYNDASIVMALGNKVDKVGGKQLSDENYSNAEKIKLQGLNNYTLPIANETTLGGLKVWFGTQSAYDAIGTKASDVLYYIQS